MTKLTTCSACQRHVFEHEAKCPFCAGEPRRLRPSLAAAALLAVGLAQGACDAPASDATKDNSSGRASASTVAPSTTPSPTSAPTDAAPPPMQVVLYGAPPMMSAVPSVSATPSSSGSSSGAAPVKPALTGRTEGPVYGAPAVPLKTK